MALAMDTARGVRQLTTTDGAWVYNNTSCPATGSVESGKAWYFYADSTADYATMMKEYIYAVILWVCYQNPFKIILIKN